MHAVVNGIRSPNKQAKACLRIDPKSTAVTGLGVPRNLPNVHVAYAIRSAGWGLPVLGMHWVSFLSATRR